MKKIINLLLILIMLSMSVNAYYYWERTGNSFMDSSMGVNYWCFFSSPSVSQHQLVQATTCTITNTNTFSPLVADVNYDLVNEIIVFDATNMYVYSFNCSLLTTIVLPAAIVSQPVIIDQDTLLSYDLIINTATRLYLYEFDAINYLVTIDSIASIDSNLGSEGIICGTDSNDICMSIYSNELTIFYLNNLTSMNLTPALGSSFAQFSQPLVLMGGGSQFNYITSASKQETPLLLDYNSAGSQTQKLIFMWSNGTVRQSCTALTGTPNPASSNAYSGWGSGLYPDRFFHSGQSRGGFTARMFDSSCTLLLSLVAAIGTQGLSNFVLSDFNKDGSEELSIMYYNSTANISQWQLKSFTKGGVALWGYNITNTTGNKTGYKTLIIADMKPANSYKELITEDGIYSFDGTSFILDINITDNRGKVGGVALVAYTDISNGINRAIYTDSSKITIFGYAGLTESVPYLYCGDNTCNNGETMDSCPVDCDPFFTSVNCYAHPSPPCIYETYFEYNNPIKIQDKGWELFFHPNTNLYTTDSKLDFSGYSFYEEVLNKYLPSVTSPYYTLELSANMRDTKSSLELVISEQGTSLDVYDRLDIFFDRGNISYYYKDNFGQRALADVCKNCIATNIEQDYKIYFFFKDTPLRIFDNSTNLTDTAKANTYAIWQDGYILKANIPFLSTDSLEDGVNFDHLSFGVKNQQGFVNLTLDGIYLYEGSNNATSNVVNITRDTIFSLNQSTKCIGGFCKKGGQSLSTNWDCNVKPQCCGIRTDGSYKVNDGWCVIWESGYDLIIKPLIKWIFISVIAAVFLLFIGGTLYILWLKANK